MTEKRWMATLGEALSELRKSKGMTIDDLARESKVNRQVIMQIERGEGNPVITTIEKLSNALGKSLYEICKEKDL